MSGSPPRLASPDAGCIRSQDRTYSDLPPQNRQTRWPSAIAYLLSVAFCIFLSASSTIAQSTETGTAAGLSGATTAAPGDEVQIFSIGLTGDGNGHPVLLRLTLSDLSSATGTSASEISTITVYESTDNVLDGGDTSVGTQSSVSLGLNSISITTSDIPNTTEYYYFATATIATTVTEGHAFRVAFNTNHVSMDDGNDRGTAFTASDANKVTITVTGTQLALTTAPADANVFDTGNDEVVSGEVFDTQPVVTVRDANNNVDLDFSDNIVASLTSGSGSLSGTTSIAPSNGVATFTNLEYTAASDGESFQITFDDVGGGVDPSAVTTAGGLSADVVATQLVITQQPSGAVNGSALTTQPQITARDADGLTDTDFTDTITLSASGSGSLANETLSATSGVATFTSFQYTTTVDQESLTITADDASGGSGGDLGTVTSNSLTASAGPAAQLDLSFDNSDVQADGSSTKSVTVIVQDATGLKRSTDNATSVTLSVSGTGSGGGTQTVSGGQATFTVTASTSVGTVNLSATSGGLTGDTGSFNTANQTPVANAQTVSATEDQDVTITFSGSDADGDAITFQISTLPANGQLYQTSDGTTRGGAISGVPTTVSDSGGRVIYISAKDGNGSGHGNFGFKSNDGSATSSEATVTVNVTGTEDPPVAVNDNLSVNEDAPADLDVLANDTDPDGDTLSIQSVTGASRGNVSINGSRVRYVPEVNFHGSDGFDYTISDGKGNTSEASVSITVVSVNDAPVAGVDRVSTAQDTRVRIMVLDNDHDIESEVLSVVGTSFPQNGTVSVTSGRFVEYLPGTGFHGSDTFTYTLKDGDGGTSIGTVEVTVSRKNKTPIARPDTAWVGMDDVLPVSITVTANDSDPDGDALTLTRVDAGPLTGSVAVEGEASVLYDPVGLVGGIDVLTYAISDGFGGSGEGTLVVLLERANTPPVASDDTVRVKYPEVAEVLPLVNDIDAEGDPLRILSVLDIEGVSVVVDSATIRLTPDSAGLTTLTYVVADSAGLADTATVVVNTWLNVAPRAGTDSIRVRMNGAAQVDLLLNDVDDNGDPLTVVTVTPGPETEQAELLEGGILSYAPRTGAVGSDELSYVVVDEHGGETTGSIIVTIDNNRDPLAVRDSVSTGVGREVVLDVLRNDSDPDTDDLNLARAWGGTMGVPAVENGMLRYRPDPEVSGMDTVEYEVSDGRGGVATGIAVIQILTEPPPGDFDGDFQSGPEDVMPFAEAFGAVAGGNGFNAAFDLNGNGVVDYFDFLELVALWRF